MLTDIIPEIIEEPAKAGCAPGNETIGYLAGEISRLRSELRNIATAKPSEWGEMSDQFQPWAQNRARAALTPPNDRSLATAGAGLPPTEQATPRRCQH